jgi:hypothetical protein
VYRLVPFALTKQMRDILSTAMQAQKHADSVCARQNSVGTLMNIADDPTQVSGGGSWRQGDIIRRIPIILTGIVFWLSPVMQQPLC